MESFIHPVDFGEPVRAERKRLGLNQVAVYRFLFPQTNKEEETIKKKMNNIENGEPASASELSRSRCFRSAFPAVGSR